MLIACWLVLAIRCYDQFWGLRYGNFDIILDHFSRTSQLHPHPTRTVCYTGPRACTDRVLTGAWHPTVCPTLGYDSSLQVVRRHP